MKRFANAALLGCTVLSGLGGLAAAMQWLGITPRDFRVTMTHAGWLALAVGLYAVCVVSSAYAWIRLRSAPADYALPTSWRVLTLQKAWYAASKPGSDDNFRHKVRFTITATEDLEVWTPLWESAEVHPQHPLTAGLRREGPKGAHAEDWEAEAGCFKLTAGQTFTGWIGLHPPSGDGLDVRVRMRRTGFLLFPLKLAGKLRYERVPI